ncbi:MAG: Asp-tRNA(Asn)/Glu-tRNA(Gln) amidotransferase subunit GatC [Planctomycetaceae bacterium]|jgi:aspartyl-tRNA(Asn)/glutamyl-tRNA(Gln) amidotransferase subunit C|nr:Asp-tRNA(Asn)/Glu-tRNA(Gln) amidotransferase subunit GatC [Planctomycetales bacterium]MCB9875104.1 Asp-tRNA(Asn)/Glu-tRNA(Gln) amidotransferase subunit GatC [Planctomycetaceae bacterium]MCB9941026.1 Asp-tRNA(Asn)/Glu-tRNA(Gln) amidotransferase subunit GatC [Planctomycetaceae bacterium]
MGLSRDEVAKVSLLARLRFDEAELDTLTTQLSQVVEYVRQLEELDTESVQPMAHVEDIHNVLADDVARPSLDRDEALANAPKRDDECYRVPAVLGE